VDDFVAAGGVCLLAADVWVLVDEQHPAPLGDQAAELLPELSEPAGWHV